MTMFASQRGVLWFVLALAIQLGCEPLDVHDVDTDGAVTGASETLDVWFTSGTDEAGASSESGESGRATLHAMRSRAPFASSSTSRRRQR
jgi:hypothetical protein